MMKQVLQMILTFALFTTLALPSQALEGGTREEAIGIVNAVKVMAEKDGTDATFEAISSKKFTDRDLYPFVFNMDGKIIAHGVKPALIGKNLLNMKDPDGTFFVQEMITIAQSGKAGWVDYKWPNPVSNKIENKSAYIANIGTDYFVGVGVHGK